MSISFIPIETYRKKFYSKEKTTQRFLDISEEQLLELSKKVYRKQEMMDDISSYYTAKISKLDRYKRILQYLTNPHIHTELNTFDERIAFLIMMVDPNLVTFKEFLKMNLPNVNDISEDVEDEKEKECKKKSHNQTIASYKSTVREKIGFFDHKLLKYEELFFKRFFNDKELITEVGISSYDQLLFMAKVLSNFDSISDERYNELSDIAQTWISLVPENYSAKLVAYSVTNQKRLLGLSGFAEQLALFILLVDSNLDMLRIYEEESLIPKVKNRITEQFGYYDRELVVLERKFHKRFSPDKEISPWLKIK